MGDEEIIPARDDRDDLLHLVLRILIFPLSHSNLSMRYVLPLEACWDSMPVFFLEKIDCLILNNKSGRN